MISAFRSWKPKVDRIQTEIPQHILHIKNTSFCVFNRNMIFMLLKIIFKPFYIIRIVGGLSILNKDLDKKLCRWFGDDIPYIQLSPRVWLFPQLFSTSTMSKVLWKILHVSNIALSWAHFIGYFCLKLLYCLKLVTNVLYHNVCLFMLPWPLLSASIPNTESFIFLMPLAVYFSNSGKL